MGGWLGYSDGWENLKKKNVYPCQESNPLNYGFWLPMTLGYAVGLGDPSIPNE